MAVAGMLGFDARPHRPSRSTLKPLAKNYLAEVFSTNLTHVLETYEWGDLRPLTTDGVTVAGFWDPASAPSPPAGYCVAGSATR